MIKAILFDNDGVLVDTEPLYCTSYIEALAHFGITITPEFYLAYWTRAGKSITDFIVEHRLSISLDDVRKLKNRILHEKFKTELRVYDGVHEKLAELSKAYPLGLVTSSYQTEVNAILDITWLRKYFQAVITRDDVSASKPDPEGFLKGAQALSVSPLDAIVIEDAEKGIKAAVGAGMRAIAIPNAYTKDNDFSLAYKVIGSIRELTVDLLSGM
ncbi:MAG: HAD family phosphatase [Nanoarchaeota archaeon]